MSRYPWQQKQWQLLMKQYQQNRLPHAVMLTGVEGVGKFDFAEVFAGRVLCENESHDDNACGQCRGCQLVSAGSHPDLFLVMPEEKSKAIKVDQVRKLIDGVNKTAHRGNHQVALIYPAELMNRSAANALLKTLEEPHGKVLLLLICNRTGSVPATILSRCQKIHFVADDNEGTQAWLASQLDANFNPRLLLKMSDHAPLKAIELAKADYLLLRDNLLEYLLQISSQKINPIASVAEYVKQDIKNLFRVFISLVMDVIRLQLGVSQAHIINEDRYDALQSLSQQLSRSLLHDFLRDMQHSQHLLHSNNVNVQLLLESLLIRWYQMRSENKGLAHVS